jgi:hypothetical protein
MCFSATASFAAGAVLVAMGSVAAWRAPRRAELPYALIPAWFGVQQLMEGALWLGLQDPSHACNAALTQLYSGFSQVIWPLYIPVAVLLLETVPWRRKAMWLVTLAGATVSFLLLYFLSHLQVESRIEGGHISYIFPHFHKTVATGLYLLSACISPLLSSHRSVRVFGMAVTLALIVTYVFYSQWFISVWCFLAAIMSTAVLGHFKKKRPVGHVERSLVAT